MTKNISSFLQGLSQASLSRKILIAIVTIVLILSSVSLLFIDQGVRRQVEKNILTQLDSAATAYIELNDARLEQVLARTQFFIQSPTFQRDMRGAPATSAKVSAGFKKVTDFDFLMVVSFTGRVLIDSLYTLIWQAKQYLLTIKTCCRKPSRTVAISACGARTKNYISLSVCRFWVSDAVLLAGNVRSATSLLTK
jgi:hypothetical protein